MIPKCKYCNVQLLFDEGDTDQGFHGFYHCPECGLTYDPDYPPLTTDKKPVNFTQGPPDAEKKEREGSSD